MRTVTGNGANGHLVDEWLEASSDVSPKEFQSIAQIIHRFDELSHTGVQRVRSKGVGADCLLNLLNIGARVRATR